MRTWLDFMENRINGAENNVPWFLEDKLRCYQFCHDNGIATTEVLRIFDSPDQIRFPVAETDFVLKPTRQSSMKGVMVLRKVSNGYYDLIRQRTMTFKQVVDEQTSVFEDTHSQDNRLIVERKVSDADGYDIPRDFKAYAFRGEIALMLIIDRNTKPATVSFFDSDFQPLTDGSVTSNPNYVSEVFSVTPDSAESILDLARKTSLAVPSPFARIDMYSTANGPMVGEVTLTPGGFYYGQHYELSSQQQMRLGLMWHRAL